MPASRKKAKVRCEWNGSVSLDGSLIDVSLVTFRSVFKANGANMTKDKKTFEIVGAYLINCAVIVEAEDEEAAIKIAQDGFDASLDHYDLPDVHVSSEQFVVDEVHYLDEKQVAQMRDMGLLK